MRRWLVILLACQSTDTTDDDGPTDDDGTPPDTDTDLPPTGETDTAWVIDTGETGIAPECPGVVGAKVCGPLDFIPAPGGAGGDSGDSGDSGGSGGGGAIPCISISVEFNPDGVAKIVEANDDCVPYTMDVPWECVAENLIEFDNLGTGVWTPRTSSTGAMLASAMWPPLTEENCDRLD